MGKRANAPGKAPRGTGNFACGDAPMASTALDLGIIREREGANSR